MNNDDNNLDLLDLDDDTPVEALPETTPFAAPRPRKPWLLMGLGVVVIILATYIIIRTIGGNSSETIEINLDEPAVVVAPDMAPMPNDRLNVPPKPVPVEVAKPAPQPVVQPRPVPEPVAISENGVPVRVVAERQDVMFNPNKPVAEAPKPVAKPASQPTAKPAATQPTAKPATKPAEKPAQKAAVAEGSKGRAGFRSSARCERQDACKADPRVGRASGRHNGR